MRISGPDDRTRAEQAPIFPALQVKRRGASLGAAALAGSLLFALTGANIRAQAPDWELKPVESEYESAAARFNLWNFGTPPAPARNSSIRFSGWHDAVPAHRQILDPTIAPADFAQPTTDTPIPRPSYLDIPEPRRPGYLDIPEPAPPPLDAQNPELTVTEQLEQLKRRLDEMDTVRVAQEDATRTIIRQSFAERGSNITDAVVFGGTLETLTFWQNDFDGISTSDIIMDTAELDFDIQMNTWSRAALYIEYFAGDDFTFPTTEGDEVFVDRFIVRKGIITIGDVTRYPIFLTTGRDFVPFGTSTGDPVTDFLTITDPLTVEVFQMQEDFFMIGFETPVPPPPAPVSPYSRPPVAARPILFYPVLRGIVRNVCPYCGPGEPPPKLAPTPYTCVAPYVGAIYFFNGNTLEGINDSDHIEQMGGTLGYRAKGLYGPSRTPWNFAVNVDANSSVFDTNFLQFEYRHFLPQIGFVPGMAAHVKSSFGPIGIVLEWDGAISNANFVDDAGNPISIAPQAWQIALNYQFDWNPTVEVIGAQGTYLAIDYSETRDLAGVTRIVDPLAPVPTRVGFVPERRFSIGVGEWIFDGMRVAIEYSHAWDYDVDEGGTGNQADGVFMQWTYEW